MIGKKYNKNIGRVIDAILRKKIPKYCLLCNKEKEDRRYELCKKCQEKEFKNYLGELKNGRNNNIKTNNTGV
jgi:hypothetical protein